MTHDEYIASVRQQIGAVAKAMLDGEITYLEGSIKLVRLRDELELPFDDPDLLVFVAIESETDHLPNDATRQYWSEEALLKHRAELVSAEEYAKTEGVEACGSLVRRFYA